MATLNLTRTFRKKTKLSAVTQQTAHFFVLIIQIAPESQAGLPKLSTFQSVKNEQFLTNL